MQNMSREKEGTLKKALFSVAYVVDGDLLLFVELYTWIQPDVTDVSLIVLADFHSLDWQCVYANFFLHTPHSTAN